MSNGVYSVLLLYAVILNGVKNLSGSTTVDPPTDCKILRSAQDDIALVLSETKETERPGDHEKPRTLYAVILNGVKNLSGSTTIDPPTDCEILRYAQDDVVLLLRETAKTERP